MKKEVKKATKKVAKKAVKKSELDIIMEKTCEQISAAMQKQIKVIKKYKCTKEWLKMFEETHELSIKLDEVQKMYSDLRNTMWTKIKKDIKFDIKKYGSRKIKLHFNEEKKTIEIVEDNTPCFLSGMININK